MNDKIGPMYIQDPEETGTYYKPYSKALDDVVDMEARSIIANAYQKTQQILRENSDKLQKVGISCSLRLIDLTNIITCSWPKPYWRKKLLITMKL